MEYVKPFLIGGGVIGGSKLASKIMGPALAPLVGGMPTGIIASFFLKGLYYFILENKTYCGV